MSSGGMFQRNWWLVIGLVSGLTSCTVGPDYRRPDVEVPAQYKETAGWKIAAPQDMAAPDSWWKVYADPTLDALAAQVAVSNQNLQAAEAVYRQATAALSVANAGYFPNLSGDVSVSRSHATTTTDTGTGGTATRTTARAGLSASWEPDLWGRVRRTVEANTAAVAASAADLRATLLSTQGTLAQTYVQLRVAEEQRRLLEETATAYARALQITRNRYKAGVASRLDVAQAETQLESTRAAAIDLQAQRAQLEHALAILVGKAPANFHLDAGSQLPLVPVVPLAVPSALLERRPDIAASERRMAVANANIGVAQSAYYPSISLTASTGVQGSSLGNLISQPQHFWSILPDLAETLFDGGLRKGQKEQAMAAYDASVAQYRQTVLSAFQEVEDNLAVLRVLADETVAQDAATRAAAQSQQLAINQYKAGTVSYLNVVTAQSAALAAARATVDIRGRQLLASIALLKAMGGDWQATSAEPGRTAGRP